MTRRFICLDIQGSDSSIENNDILAMPIDAFGPDASIYDTEQNEFAIIPNYEPEENFLDANLCDGVRMVPGLYEYEIA